MICFVVLFFCAKSLTIHPDKKGSRKGSRKRVFVQEDGVGSCAERWGVPRYFLHTSCARPAYAFVARV